MRFNDLTLILPTLNEEKSAYALVSSLRRQYPGARLIIVDDGSTDKTESIVRGMSGSDKNIAIIERRGKRKGLTRSVIDGILRSRTRFVVVMDADLQHPPETVGRIYSSLSSGFDMSIAVRNKVENWPLYRKMVSKSLGTIGLAVLLATGKKTSSDIFSGFFGMRRKLAVSLIRDNRGRFVGEGYKVLFDILKCIDRRAMVRMSEIPYTFRQREFGSSKAGAKQVLALFRSFLS